jgi:hypothetical protein
MLQLELAPSMSRCCIAVADKMYNSQRPDRGLFHVKCRLQTDTHEIEISQTCAFRELQSNILSKPEIEKFSNLHLQGTAIQHPDQT